VRGGKSENERLGVYISPKGISVAKKPPLDKPDRGWAENPPQLLKGCLPGEPILDFVNIYIGKVLGENAIVSTI
jgi:hypothetical protein